MTGTETAPDIGPDADAADATPPVDPGTPAAADGTDGTDGREHRHATVERALRLRDDVTARLDELVGGLDAEADPGDVYVGWVAAAEVAQCPARFRAGGEDGWGFPGWSPALAAGAVGRVALARHLDRHVVASQ
ncbi:MAG TPA: hypothetical protein VIL36_20010, partial [Acidimicrobiales bacterium]